MSSASSLLLTEVDQENYDRLLNVLELSLGQLELLLVVCDDRNQQAEIIDQYSAELRSQSIAHYHTQLPMKEPNLRSALDRLVQQYPDLEPTSAVVTILGTDHLIELSPSQNQRQEFYGYLQWRREALRDFSFPVVLWLTHQIYREMIDYAPDFWSWRGGVFWFGTEKNTPALAKLAPPATLQTLTDDPELQSLLQRLEAAEQTPENTADLAALYGQLGEIYNRRTDNTYNRQFAIQAF
ncbi:MAG: tetratricopeptide repeat protein, partial [Prochlorotrichaceae cyanobacterium]